ncbi:hypothetical protein [Chryseobacterium sp. ISL-6]|uniref:hypothetical protein n=1 Tax=Chryseobacterium sp. ISL-6 TaxID=2819143 RepID=UPI001BE6BAAD|nr:hypothetical protein [Chryseobacterium sp. ISL-6]MBT2623626.1 hypothetical protein [Chryseobacterium sp. ISL-6]
MSRLSLDQFKKETDKTVKTEELAKLTGGILGACHTVVVKPSTPVLQPTQGPMSTNPLFQ